MSGPDRRTSEEVIAASKDPQLGEYLRKRTFGPEGTTEPAPGDASGPGNSFVIHKHRATRLHYDVRLERDGALPSWAVPRGLPTRPGDKRLAVRTEDHPLEYGSFEGTIPEGHYGAGEVRIFDDGWYEPLEWTEKKVSFRPARAPVPGPRVPLREDTDRLAGVPRFPPAGPDARLVPRDATDARRGRVAGVRRPRVVVRAEVRRDPGHHDDGDRTRRSWSPATRATSRTSTRS